MLSKKTLKSLLVFTENQQVAPSFLFIYIVTWCAWHNQLFSAFIAAQGDFWQKVNAALTALTNNQYLVVFFLSCLILTLRLVYNFLRFKSRELLNDSDQAYVDAKEGRNLEASNDIAQLMSTLTTVKEQLAKAKEREKLAIISKNDTIRAMLSLQNELDEAKADIALLRQVK